MAGADPPEPTLSGAEESRQHAEFRARASPGGIGAAATYSGFQSGEHIWDCIVSDGVIHRRDRVRVKRGSEQQWEGGIGSLKRFKDDVNEVREGFECGIALDGWDELAEGDTMEMFSSERI